MGWLRSGPAAWRHWAIHSLDERDRSRDRREATLLGLCAGFVLINAVALGLVRGDPSFWGSLAAVSAVWLAAAATAHLLIRAFKPDRDPYLLPVFFLLIGWGLLLQARLAPNFLGRQTLWFALATVVLLLVAIAPRSLRFLHHHRYVLLFGGLILLAVTLLFGVNPSGSGPALWLTIPLPFLGNVYIQPSELLKVLLVIFLASYFTDQEPLYRYRKQVARQAGGPRPGPLRRIVRQLPFLGPLLLMWGFCLILLVWQQDLGAAALFFIVFIALLYLATGEWAYVWSGLGLLVAAGAIAFFAFDTVIAPRVLTWLNPWPNVSDRAYQVVQSLYAQAAGGVFGRGIGQGFPDFIPVVHSDFALAAVAEEWGLAGSLTVIAAFAVLALRGLRAALRSLQARPPLVFNAYLAAGLVVLFSVQAVLIIGGVIKLLPLTGITLPFISYGGSSLLVSGLMVGLLLHLSAARAHPQQTRAYDARLARRIERLGLALLAAFAAVALTLAYWGIVRSDALAAREDNPRLVEAERRVRRGRILDRNGAVLAESVPADGGLERVYPLPESGPAVGYYSLRYGSAGIEGALDPVLRGDADGAAAGLERFLLQSPPVGRDVELTLDAALQQEATARLAGRRGGLVLLELVDGAGGPEAAIRALASRPGYNPNTLDERFEALAADDAGPLFDRAAQGLYQPGLILQPFLTAAAVDSGALDLGDPLLGPFMPVAVAGHVQRCAVAREDSAVSGEFTWADMAALRCPAPLHALGARLGDRAIEDILARFGLTQLPELPIPTAGSASAGISDAGLAAIGQDNLTLSPLQAALATAALANDGGLLAPRLVEAIGPPGESGDSAEWESWPVDEPSGDEAFAVSRAAARAVRETWPVTGDIREFTVSALSGPEGNRNTWYVAMAPADAPRYVLALVLENERNVAEAEAIGRAVLAAAEGNPATDR